VSPEPVTVPAGRAAWRRTLEVREGFLAAGDPDRLPPPACGVRREIVLSWRRCVLSGVDPASTELPRDGAAEPPERLVLAARPVLDRLAEQLAGMPVWSFLADRECRLVRHVVGDPALVPQLEARGAVPGARFAEDVVGTNGLGTAVEQGRPFIVAGSEHFRSHESQATTVGAPVRDPVTGRLVGLLNVNCQYDLTNGLLLPFITEFARSIEARLLGASPVPHQVLLEEFLRVSRRCPHPVVALADGVLIASATALALLDAADHELLRQWADDAGSRGRERAARLQLTGGRAVTARCLPLPGRPGQRAAVVVLGPAAEPESDRGARTSARSSAGDRLLAQLETVRAGRLPLLLTGERGTGKTVLAARLHGQGRPGDLIVLDAAAGQRPPDAWARELGEALADPARTVVLRHLDALSPALAGPTALLADSARARLAATATETIGERADLAALTERFAVVLSVPPLRDRPADIPALVTGIIAELHPRLPRPRCTAAALAALANGGWQGNVRQLRQVVATALVRSMSCDITADDLPGSDTWAGCGRKLPRLEQAERQVLVMALRDAAGDREAAARELGISRATIYRKLKRHGIRSPAVAGRARSEAR
jgi:sigma-54 dependent transcriptional regulator, acetoin dehydrogenase operon transcriptional activator AcoR